MAPRRVFQHDGKTCYAIAELSTCHTKALGLLLSTLSTLVSVPIECREKDMRLSGMSPGRDYYVDLKVCPLASEATSETYVDTRVDGGGANKKRKKSPTASPVRAGGGEDEEQEEVYTNDDIAADSAPLQTKTDFYRRYDSHDVTVQVDIDCLLHMTSVAKGADTLSIVVYSFCETGEPERILISSSDRNTSTIGTVTPQSLTCEVWALPSFKAVTMVVIQADNLSDHIKTVSAASQSSYVTISMTGNQADKTPGATPQTLSLAATGDTGTITRHIRSDQVANVKFVNDTKTLLPTDQIYFVGRYGSKPLVQIGRIAPICKFVRMYLSPGVPLKLHYPVPDLADLFFFLSPQEEEPAAG